MTRAMMSLAILFAVLAAGCRRENCPDDPTLVDPVVPVIEYISREDLDSYRDEIRGEIRAEIRRELEEQRRQELEALLERHPAD